MNGKEPGTVYIVGDGTGLFKIGCTNDLPRRIKELKYVYGRLIFIAYAFRTDDKYHDERELQDLFTCNRVVGEWFILNRGDIAKIKAQYPDERRILIVSTVRITKPKNIPKRPRLEDQSNELV